jgi:hypothetical protein
MVSRQFQSLHFETERASKKTSESPTTMASATDVTISTTSNDLPITDGGAVANAFSNDDLDYHKSATV